MDDEVKEPEEVEEDQDEVVAPTEEADTDEATDVPVGDDEGDDDDEDEEEEDDDEEEAV